MKSFVFALLVALASGAWVIQPSTTSGIIVGVGAGGAGGASIAGGTETTGGSYVEFSTNGAQWTKTNVQSGIFFDAAVNDDSSLKVVASMLPVFVSQNGGAYEKLSTIAGDFMTASIFGDNIIGLVGGIVHDKVSTNGVAVSSDKGATWSVSAVPSSYSRYGSFIDKDTWFVSSGTWAMDTYNATASSALYLRPPADAVSALDPKHLRLRYRNQQKAAHTRRSKGLEDEVNDNGWLASVSKTTDGGKSYTEVYRLPQGDMYYFNGISCTSATHCVVVGEGETPTDPFLTVAFTTMDGGATWAQTLYSTELFSLMAVHMTSETDGWLAGGQKSRGVMIGQFYTTTDGGMTWTLSQSLNDCYPLDMDFSDGKGVASCMSSSGQSCSLATFA